MIVENCTNVQYIVSNPAQGGDPRVQISEHAPFVVARGKGPAGGGS